MLRVARRTGVCATRVPARRLRSSTPSSANWRKARLTVIRAQLNSCAKSVSFGINSPEGQAPLRMRAKASAWMLCHVVEWSDIGPQFGLAHYV